MLKISHRITYVRSTAPVLLQNILVSLVGTYTGKLPFYRYRYLYKCPGTVSECWCELAMSLRTGGPVEVPVDSKSLLGSRCSFRRRGWIIYDSLLPTFHPGIYSYQITNFDSRTLFPSWMCSQWCSMLRNCYWRKSHRRIERCYECNLRVLSYPRPQFLRRFRS